MPLGGIQSIKCTELTIKKLIVVADKTIMEDDYLKITDGVCKEIKLNLGCKLENGNKVRILNPDPTKLSDDINLESMKPFTTQDTSSDVLSCYPEIKKESGISVIHLLDHDKYKELFSGSVGKNLVVLDYYYNGHKKNNTGSGSESDVKEEELIIQIENLIKSKESVLSEIQK